MHIVHEVDAGFSSSSNSRIRKRGLGMVPGVTEERYHHRGLDECSFVELRRSLAAFGDTPLLYIRRVL